MRGIYVTWWGIKRYLSLRRASTINLTMGVMPVPAAIATKLLPSNCVATKFPDGSLTSIVSPSANRSSTEVKALQSRF